MCLANGIIEKGEGVPCPVDLSGRFAAEVTDFAGAHVKVGRELGVAGQLLLSSRMGPVAHCC